MSIPSGAPRLPVSPVLNTVSLVAALVDERKEAPNTSLSLATPSFQIFVTKVAAVRGRWRQIVPASENIQLR